MGNSEIDDFKSRFGRAFPIEQFFEQDRVGGFVAVVVAERR